MKKQRENKFLFHLYNQHIAFVHAISIHGCYEFGWVPGAALTSKELGTQRRSYQPCSASIYKYFNAILLDIFIRFPCVTHFSLTEFFFVSFEFPLPY